MLVDINKIKPLNDDVVIVHVPERNVKKSVIIYEEESEENTAQYFRVVRAADDVKYLTVGDIVVCSWLRVTEPTLGSLDGKDVRFGITSEKEILAIVND